MGCRENYAKLQKMQVDYWLGGADHRLLYSKWNKPFISVFKMQGLCQSSRGNVAISKMLILFFFFTSSRFVLLDTW